MDFNARKSKVVRPKEMNTVHEDGVAAAVDTSLLEMLRSLQEAGGNQSFADLLTSNVQKIGYDLRLAQHLVLQRDQAGLDQLAQALTQNALKIGAVRMLTGAIEMQALARIGDFMGVAEVVTGLEAELMAVQKQLV
ncbi:MAG TPA: hypothetical protein VE954_39200 [Oligoflexus sp.]|uniref:hypothetical protein n=1 Tax=Oligoflexus sp. TaxID=1971216 RepID=UPI002D52F8D9|nr:hypothetical protein [Oligoflexus sp.]HYX39168.1 hypothetical protein [Oligoflexus sp.]